MHRFLPLTRILVLVLLAAACTEVRPAQQTLRIHTAAGDTVRYTVEVAATDAARSRGLMHRKAMAPDHGMLFLYRPARKVNMWMENTFLPLDMLFIDADHRIVKIAANTVPQSRELIPSGHAITAVLELNAGQAVRRGIAVGDRVEWGEGGWPGAGARSE